MWLDSPLNFLFHVKLWINNDLLHALLNFSIRILIKIIK
jgi:hypothetical protein